MVAKTEGTISGILTREPLSYGDPFCSIKITNIPDHSVIEFSVSSYTCTNGGWCSSGGSSYLCDLISIRGFVYPQFDLLSTSPIYVYTNGDRFIIEPSTTAIISFNITYRSKYSKSISQPNFIHQLSLCNKLSLLQKMKDNRL